MNRKSPWFRVRLIRLLLAGATVAAFTVLFIRSADLVVFLAKGQLGAALMRLAAEWSLAAAAIVALTLVLTFLFGRIYCSVFCPLGILQDLIGAAAFWRKNRPQPRRLLLRKGLGILCWMSVFIAGWTLPLRFLDPYTLFGSIAACAWVPALVILVLTLWRRRLFCNSLCPVGALLACTAAHAPVGLTIRENCIRCAKCIKACPAGCIDLKTGKIDNGRCIRCFACAAACPVQAIGIGKTGACRIPGRRTLLKAGALLFGGAAAGWGLRHLKPLYSAYGPRAGVAKEGIYPPGAGSRQRFIAKCTNCQLCVEACDGNVLQPAGTFGAVHLTFDNGMCEFNCKRCSEVCPTGAIKALDLTEKRRTRLGLAALDSTLCVAITEGYDCGACAEHCPTGALRMKEDADGIRIPVLDTRLCIGCGSCEHPCPVRPVKAIRVWPVDVQVLAADPAELFSTPEVAEPETDDWLI